MTTTITIQLQPTYSLSFVLASDTDSLTFSAGPAVEVDMMAALRAESEGVWGRITGVITDQGDLIQYVAGQVAGVTSSTNLSYTAAPDGGTVLSDTGTDAGVPLADNTNAGLMSPGEHLKVAGVEDNATANSPDSYLLDRTNHTGTQPSSTISDFNSAADARITAKIDTDVTLTANSDTLVPSQKATKTFVEALVAALVNGSPSTLDTLNELAAAIGDDPNFATTLTTLVGTKAAKSANLSDLVSATAALTNLGLTADGKSLVTATDFAAMRALLGLVIGTNVQAYDSDLALIAALVTTPYGRAFLTLADAVAGRTALGLGTAALSATGDFDAAGAAAAAQAASQPLDSDLTLIAALSTAPFGRALLTLADAPALRSTAGLGTVATQDASNISITGGTITGTMIDGVNIKSYVDGLLAGLKWKVSVIAATTGAQTLASDFENGDVIDGVTLTTGDRVLVKNQASASENGIYIVNASGAPTRSTDADSGSELVMAAVFAEQGTVNADKAFVCTNNSITLGTTSITFTSFASVVGALIAANNLSDLTSPTTALSNLGLSANGKSFVTAANYAAMRSLLSLDQVTNDAQTKAAIVPNTAPSAGQVLVGNAGGTAYAPVALSGPVSISSTGVTSVATLNQNTTGSAATLTTPRAIYGNNFNGSADLSQVIASTYGGTGNGFTKFTGPTTAERTFTLPNADATLLYSGGALGTPSSGTLTNCTGLPAAGVAGTAAILGANTFTALQTITQASANAGILASTGYSLTGSNATSMVNLAGTLNTSGVVDVLKVAITNTAVGTGSKLLNLYAGASGTTSVFSVSPTGLVTFGGNLSLPSSGQVLGASAQTDFGASNTSLMRYTQSTVTFYIASNGNQAHIAVGRLSVPSNGVIGFTSTVNDATATVDTGTARNAAGVIEVNNGTAGTYRDLKLRNLIPGASLATNMTDGFINIAGAAGAPSGTPNNTTGYPTYWDATNLQLCVYTGGAWKKSAAFT